MNPGEVVAQDGVAVSGRGDTFLIVYQRAARLHRTRWLFERINEFVTHQDGDFLVFMVVLPSADPPDGPTRAENAAQLRRLGDRLRRIITAPIGNAFRVSIVRTVMRALAAIQGKSGVHLISNTIDDGLQKVREAASDRTPTLVQLTADVRALHTALGETAIIGR
jgi:hypothetical protein